MKYEDLTQTPQFQKAVGNLLCQHGNPDDDCDFCGGYACPDHGPFNNAVGPCRACGFNGV